MFSSCQKLKEKASVVVKHSPLFLKLVGDHYAEILLLKGDGLCSSINDVGHFEFYEFKDFNPVVSVKKVEALEL